ncbi:probable transcriptional regulatory protein TTE1135 [Scylla paramamosain]
MSYLTQPLRRATVALTCRLSTQAWHCPPGPPCPPSVAWGYVGRRGMAGHSKWANIRHTKALKDDQKQRVIQKCAQMIKMAVKEGGSTDPKLNSKLARVIEHARSQNMPASSIASTLKQTQKSQDNAKSMILEYKAPGGLLLLVEVMTDNLVRTRSSIQSVIKKTSIQEVKGGGIHHLFNEKGVVIAGKDKKIQLEEALELAIEVGAEEVEEEKGGEKGQFVFTCSPEAFLEVKKGVEEQGYSVSYANIDYLPQTPLSLGPEDLERVSAVLEKLDNVEDVMRIHVNL